jgi:hypothetical protein
VDYEKFLAVIRMLAEVYTLSSRGRLGTLTKSRSKNNFEEEDHMFHKIVKLSFWLVAALSVSLCSVALQAQEPAAPAPTTAKPIHSGITVTGCLQKGDSTDEFAITGENGKTWELRSKTVKLDEHVGHTVTVTGVRHQETKAEEAKEAKTETKESKEAEAKEAGDLRVTTLKMVSDSCKP